MRNALLRNMAASGILFFLLAAFPFVVAAGEVIQSFESDIAVQKDGSFYVTETITYNFDGYEKRGIFRDLHLTHPHESSAWYKDRSIKIEVLEVLRNGQAEPYKLTQESGVLIIRVGDPDVTHTGAHVYTLSYKVSGGLLYYDDGQTELFWNVTGDGWSTRMEKVHVVVRGEDVAALGAQRTCYQGEYGTNTTCSTGIRTDGSVWFSAVNVPAGSQVSVAQQLNADVVASQVHEPVKKALYVFFALFCLVSVAGVWLHRFRTFNDPDLPVVAQYEPYKGVLPMYAGLLVDGKLHDRDITAGIMYMAQQGFIKIAKVTSVEGGFFRQKNIEDFELTLLRTPTSVDEAHSKFFDDLLELLFPITSAGAVVRLSEIQGDSSRKVANHRVKAKLISDISFDLIAQKYYEKPMRRSSNRLGAVGVAILLILLFVVKSGLYINLYVTGGIMFTGGLLIVLAVSMHRRLTREGYVARNHLLGFREFLSVTDKERFAFHNAPKKNPEQFMQYLPYAVAFGVEEQWSEVFGDLTLPEPDWYESNGGGAFSAVALSNSMDTFSHSIAGISQPPQSSGSGGSSGFSGGGFSGGGSGGGGGGSW